MTIDRAIEILVPDHREHYDGLNEACRMGMEALERQKMLPPGESFEYISRGDIMKKLTAAEAQKAVREMDGGEAYNWFLELVNFAPAADGETVRHWIPCSERWPEPETEVLAVCKRGGISFVVPAMHEDGKILKDDSIWNWNEIEEYGLYCEDADDWFIPEGWWEYRQFNDDDAYNNLVDCAVTHWMPLPEPPEEGDAGNEAD